MAFVLVADGQQIQQNLIEVAKSKVYTHHCNCITRGHLRAADGTEKQRKMSHAEWIKEKEKFCEVPHK